MFSKTSALEIHLLNFWFWFACWSRVTALDAQPLATFQAPVPAVSYGLLGGLSVHQCGSREMLHLLPAGEKATCTLVLCHRNETALAELKVGCQRHGGTSSYLRWWD